MPLVSPVLPFEGCLLFGGPAILEVRRCVSKAFEQGVIVYKFGCMV